MNSATHDMKVRQAAMAWLAEQTRLHDGILPGTVLKAGFIYQGNRVCLQSQQGIFKPATLPEMPLTISTSPKSPYADEFSPEGFLKYRYRGEDPNHRDNVGLRLAFRRGVPLIYFFGVLKSQYLPVMPVYIVADDPANLTFTVAFDEVIDRFQSTEDLTDKLILEPGADSRRAYVTRIVLQRVHQQAFRQRVLKAYRSQCALCHLKHQELLDAAHIIPDSEPEGEPLVSNGLALCKLHHAAFDRHFLGIRPDYVIEIRRDVLDESDGPMLKHGLQGLHEKRIIIPRQQILRPNPESLERRFEQFRAAG